MNETLMLRCIMHIKGLHSGSLTALALSVLDMPTVKIWLSKDSSGLHSARAVMLHDIEADTWTHGNMSQRDQEAAWSALRAALYFYAIHYPGTMVAAIDRIK